HLAADFPRAVELLFVQRRLGAAEVEGFRRGMLDAGPGAKRLVVDLEARCLVVLLNPLLHHRIEKRGAPAVELGLTFGSSGRGGRELIAGDEGKHGTTERKKDKIAAHANLLWKEKYLPRASLPAIQERVGPKWVEFGKEVINVE